MVGARGLYSVPPDQAGRAEAVAPLRAGGRHRADDQDHHTHVRLRHCRRAAADAPAQVPAEQVGLDRWGNSPGFPGSVRALERCKWLAHARILEYLYERTREPGFRAGIPLPAGADHESPDASTLACRTVLLLLQPDRETVQSVRMDICHSVCAVYHQPRQVVLSGPGISDAVCRGGAGG